MGGGGVGGVGVPGTGGISGPGSGGIGSGGSGSSGAGSSPLTARLENGDPANGRIFILYHIRIQLKNGRSRGPENLFEGQPRIAIGTNGMSPSPLVRRFLTQTLTGTVSSSKIYIGTSGWMYKSWAETFYPKEQPKNRYLEFYATTFPTVEINASFYRLPEKSTFVNWREKAPPGFIYAVKGSRAVTHLKRLKPGAKSLALLLDRSSQLKTHLGPFLWQLPPNFQKNTDRLRGFLKTLPRNLRHAMEFRHPSWLDEEILALLKKHDVAFVSVSSQMMPIHLEVTAKFTYVRFHGLKGGSAHDYSTDELQPWAKHLRACARAGMDCFVYFNNDVNSRAPDNARQLMKMVGDQAVHPPKPNNF